MRTVLRDAGLRYGADGPFGLPDPLPDIDLLAVDESSSTVLVAELKWIRKPIRPAEEVDLDLDVDVLKGVDQLAAIRGFLTSAPQHLIGQRLLPRPLNEYRDVRYCLVARDHWRSVEPNDGFVIVEFDPYRPGPDTKRRSAVQSTTCSAMDGFRLRAGTSTSGSTQRCK
jgi:hypothetical protein